ncbi:hypothetical protein [Bacillus horti]|uniref:Low copy number virion structural protein n=1 Tax=Caldalkalibacillus horti TaxID=77523 RepID=A0ABT9W037_9BACI|nr:hypothetical protein [Bacillus horti]MDQ0166615.1 hypothetical protein [Bacillus horti]
MSFGANVIVGGELERVGRLQSGRLDHPFMPLKTVPYIKGVLLEVPGMVGEYDIHFVPEFDIELISIAVGASEYHPKDHWSVFINQDEPKNYIFDEIYTKDLPEGAYLMAVKVVEKNVPITFRFNNEGGKAKYVWINFQCLRDED